MKPLPRPIALPSALIRSAPAFAADIAFFERDGFRRGSSTANQTIPSFSVVGFNDRTSSAFVGVRLHCQYHQNSSRQR
jgi:hypothetical protein